MASNNLWGASFNSSYFDNRMASIALFEMGVEMNLKQATVGIFIFTLMVNITLASIMFWAWVMK